MYLFSWDNVPGKDNGRLIEYLEQKYGVDWVRTAKIEKIDKNEIRVATEKNFLSLKLNNEHTKVILTINKVRTDEFIVKTENSMLNICPSAFLRSTRRSCKPLATRRRRDVSPRLRARAPTRPPRWAKASLPWSRYSRNWRHASLPWSASGPLAEVAQLLTSGTNSMLKRNIPADQSINADYRRNAGL